MTNSKKLSDDLNRVQNQISEVDENLGKILNSLLGFAIDKVIYKIRKEESSGEKRKEIREPFIKKVKQHIKEEAKRASKEGEINLYPAEGDVSCREICVALAFNKFGSRNDKDPGFKGVAEWLSEYWLSCSNKNKSTLIFTFSWDEVDFIERYKNNFDARVSRADKTVAVVLITPRSISLPYLR